MFEVRVLFLIFSKLFRSKTTLLVLLGVLLYVVAYLFKQFEINLPFFIDSAMAMFVFYALGNAVVRWREKILTPGKMFSVISVACLIVYCFVCYFIKPETDIKDNVFPPYLLLLSPLAISGVYVCSCFLSKLKVSKFLRVCGKESLAILGLHRPVYLFLIPILYKTNIPYIFQLVGVLLITITVVAFVDYLVSKFCPVVLGKVAATNNQSK